MFVKLILLVSKYYKLMAILSKKVFKPKGVFSAAQ
jgi:hypothetical protein